MQQEIKIMPVQKVPEDISLVYVQAVSMPNGEIICKGKSLGFFEEVDYKKYVSVISTDK